MNTANREKLQKSIYILKSKMGNIQAIQNVSES